MNNEKKAPLRQIKFRRAFFFDEECTQFSHYAEWGVKVGRHNENFTSPQANNFAPYYIDEQFTGLLDKNGKEIYEGDMVLASMKYKGVTLMPFRAYVFYNESVGSWQIKYETTTNNFATDFTYSYEIEIVGHIHEESEVSNG